MKNHYSDERELDESSNCKHESRQVDDNLQREYDKECNINEGELLNYLKVNYALTSSSPI